MKQTDPQFKFRLPPELKESLDAAATDNARTLGAEIVARLQTSFEPSAGAQDLQIALLEAQAALFDAELEQVGVNGQLKDLGVVVRALVASLQAGEKIAPKALKELDDMAELAVEIGKALDVDIDALLVKRYHAKKRRLEINRLRDEREHAAATKAIKPKKK